MFCIYAHTYGERAVVWDDIILLTGDYQAYSLDSAFTFRIQREAYVYIHILLLMYAHVCICSLCVAYRCVERASRCLFLLAHML